MERVAVAPRGRTTPAVLAEVAAAAPGQVAVLGEDATLTYAELAAHSSLLAAGLAARGLRPGDRVGILLPNGARWCVAALGAHAAGLVVVPLNTWYRRDELVHVVRRARLRLVVAQAQIFGQDVAGLLADVAAEAGDLAVLMWERSEPLPPGSPGPAGDPVAPLTAAPCSPEADALLLFTSGSTAEPKAVRLTHAGVVGTGWEVGQRQGVVPGDRIFLPSPLFFVFGCSNALPNALTHRAALCPQERFEPGAALELIERHRCTVYYGVGPVTRALAACPDLAWRDISSLRTGTANATPEDLRLAIEVLGVTGVCNAYGLTEGHGHSTITAHTDPPELRMRCQGTVLPTQQLRLVRDDGSPAAVGEPGEVQLRGTISPGYLDAPELTARTRTADGWLRTGDLCTLDAEGRLTFLGRGSDMLRAKGINIAPAEVEELLVRHPQVDEAFVVGVPTAEGDEEVAAVLVSQVGPADRAALVTDVRAWARERVAAYKVPSRLRVVAAGELPLTTTGKVSRRLLREGLLGATPPVT